MGNFWLKIWSFITGAWIFKWLFGKNHESDSMETTQPYSDIDNDDDYSIDEELDELEEMDMLDELDEDDDW